MEIVVDACTLINLINSGVIHKVLQLPSARFFVGSILLETEILDTTQQVCIQALIGINKISIIDDLALQEFTALKSKYQLGNGETESIAICKKHNMIVATDDSKARKAANLELSEQPIGSLFLLRESVKQNQLSCFEAMEAYDKIKTLGGFVPKVDQKYICNE